MTKPDLTPADTRPTFDSSFLGAMLRGGRQIGEREVTVEIRGAIITMRFPDPAKPGFTEIASAEMAPATQAFKRIFRHSQSRRRVTLYRL